MKKFLFVSVFLLSALIACETDLGYQLDEPVAEFIKSNYRGAKVLEAEYTSTGLYEVEISHKKVVKDVYFTLDNEWAYTTWDVNRSSLPKAVKNYVEENYPGYTIDNDADYFESPTIEYYSFEIEKGIIELPIVVTPNGEKVELSDIIPSLGNNAE